ncbi:MAG: UbiA family prenyltransferase [Patescibacteria group bacterium]
MKKKENNKIFSELIYGGHFQCLSAVSIVYITSVFLETPLSWQVLVVVYLIFYPIYLFDRYRGIKEDRSTNTKRTAHIKSYYKFIPFIIAGNVLILEALIYFYGNNFAILWSLLVIFLGFAYQDYFKKLTKRIFLFKNAFVALFFSIVVLFYIFYHSLIRPDIYFQAYVIMGIVFLKVFFIQILFDIKDMSGDKKQGLLTLPVVIGKEKTIIALFVLNLLLTALLLFLSAVHIFYPAILGVILSLPYTLFYLKKAKNRPVLSYNMAAFELVVWGAMVMLITNLHLL